MSAAEQLHLEMPARPDAALVVELVEALERLVEVCDGWAWSSEDAQRIEAARATAAKARGTP